MPASGMRRVIIKSQRPCWRGGTVVVVQQAHIPAASEDLQLHFEGRHLGTIHFIADYFFVYLQHLSLDQPLLKAATKYRRNTRTPQNKVSK